jgi:hypothetical protein
MTVIQSDVCKEDDIASAAKAVQDKFERYVVSHEQ